MENTLFVYGTLMQNINSKIAQFLHQNSKLIGPGRLSGQLYDLGRYPGAIFRPDTEDHILGTVFELQNAPHVLAILDEYEGVIPEKKLFFEAQRQDLPPAAEYTREWVPVLLQDNSTRHCWYYQYNLDPSALPRIPSGDYLSYMQGNNDHQSFIDSV